MKITLDITNYSQSEKNAIHAIASLLLYNNGITHEGIKANNETGEVEVINPSKDIESIITEQEILDTYVLEEDKRQQAIQVNVAKVEDIKSRVDASNLSDEDKKEIQSLLQTIE